jgi:hypothetical protein
MDEWKWMVLIENFVLLKILSNRVEGGRMVDRGMYEPCNFAILQI